MPIYALSTQYPAVSDAAYAAGWDSDTTTIASKNALYDKIETLAAAGANADITSLTAPLGLGIATSNVQLQIHEASSGSCLQQFTNSTTGSTGSDGGVVGLDAAEKMVFGTVESNDSYVITSNTARMTIEAAGRVLLDSGQLGFPATQNASSNANTLDDYEEGTWTPVLKFDTGSTGITYSNQLGTYTKIGNTVQIHCRASLTSKGSSTGQINITGFPFTCTNNPQLSIYMYNCTYDGQYTGQLSTTIFYMYEIAETGNPTAITDADAADTLSIRLTGTYTV